jgi:hypothetical protein
MPATQTAAEATGFIITQSQQFLVTAYTSITHCLSLLSSSYSVSPPSSATQEPTFGVSLYRHVASVNCVGLFIFFCYYFSLQHHHRHPDRLVLYGDWLLNHAMVLTASSPPSAESS